MKNIIIKNIEIQFDSFDDNVDKLNVRNTLHSINNIIQETFPDIHLQIPVYEIQDEDIEIVNE